MRTIGLLSVMGLMGLMTALPGQAVPPDADKPGSELSRLRTADTAKASEGTQDMIFLGDRGPVLIRLHVQLDGKSLVAAWNEFVQDVFRYCDVDGDGVLSKEEVEYMIPPQFLLSGGLPGRGIPPQRPILGRGQEEVTYEQFRAYFAASGAAPFQAQGAAGAGQNVQGLTQSIFQHLDTNHDGRLSREELAAAEKVLMQLDTDDDEILTPQELGPTPYVSNPLANFRVVGGGDSRPLDDNDSFLVLTPGERPERFVAAMQRRYGKGTHQSFTLGESRLDPETFDLLDKNRDGRLDANELAEFTHRPADIEVAVKISGRNRDNGTEREQTSFAIRRVKESLGKLEQSAGDSLTLELGNTKLLLRGLEGTNPAFRAAFKIKDLYLQQFKAADTDNSGYLDLKKVENNPFFQSTFKMMDRDRDGKVTEKEVLAFLEVIERFQNLATACRASLTISEGQWLFDVLDANHDGRLTIRELRAAPKLLDLLDKSGAGSIALGDIPRSYQLSFARGQVGPSARQFAVKVATRGEPPPRRESAAGPLWFRKMDKNRDGDVSRREFLGRKEEFDRIDTDGDGLISLQEAEAYDAKMRQQSRAGR